jgi:predicted hydrolase (HD superfamily)
VAVDVNAAGQLAEEHLSSALPRRWTHTQAVVEVARRVAPIVGDDGDLLVASAWLHDIGYAPDLVDTGFHPLDGARFLRRLGAPVRLAGLVAHHTAALIEAEERGLGAVLVEEFPVEESVTADALWYCDLTIGPEGKMLTVERRLSEIQQRYGPSHVVTRFVDRARSNLLAAAQRTEAQLALAALA